MLGSGVEARLHGETGKAVHTGDRRGLGARLIGSVIALTAVAWCLAAPGLASAGQTIVSLTFDDGKVSQYGMRAELASRGMHATFFVNTPDIGTSAGMSWQQLHDLEADGNEIGGHTLTHPDLTTLDAAGLHREIVVSRAVLQALSGEPVSFFCYPSGRYDATVVAAVKAAGFVGATTTDVGLATPTDLFTLARVRVHRAMSLAAFAHSLAH